MNSKPVPYAGKATIAAFVVTTAAVLALALNGGGYDLVVRQEAALAAWWLLALGFAFGFLPRARPPKSARVPLIAAAALVVWMALSVAWTETDERALEELARTVGYLGAGTLVFTTLGPRTWRAAAAGLALAAVGVCAAAMLARLDPGTFHESAGFIYAFGTKRLAYPLGYWNAVGTVAAMALVMALAWSAHARAGGLRGLALAATPLAGAVVYLTYSRTAVITAVVGAIAVVAISANRRTAREHALAAAFGVAAVILTIHSRPEIAQGNGAGGWAIVLAAILVAAAGCAQVAYRAPAGATPRRRTSPGVRRLVAVVSAIVLAGFLVALALAPRPQAAEALPSPTADGQAAPIAASGGDSASRLTSTGGPRGELWSAGLHAFADHPLEGLGAGSYEFYWDRTTTNGQPIRDAHSVVITSMAELGLPGLALIAALGAGLVALCVRARRLAGSAGDAGAVTAVSAGFLVFAISAAVDWSYEIPAVGVLGIACAAVGGCSFARTRRRPRSGRRSFVLVALAVLAGLVQVPGIVGTQLVRASSAQLAGGNFDRAASLAADAASAEPWAASPRLQEGVVAFQNHQAATAVRYVQEAVDRELTNFYLRLTLAQFEALAGQTPAALATLATVRELRPAIDAQVNRAIREIAHLPGGRGG